MHTSLDGFTGGPNGEMDWIRVGKEMFDYAGRMTDEADTALYGRATYQLMENYWPTAGSKPDASNHDVQHSQWYNRVEKIVVSKSMTGGEIHNARIISENLPEEIQRLKEKPGKNIQMFGSPSLSHSLMQLNLIDEYWLFVNPILIGTGIPLFKNIKDKINLKLLQSDPFLSGVVLLHYEKSM
jgi:dihydrofolate reductase